MFLNDTIAAISTGINNSGIGIIRISGIDSFVIAKSIFFSKSGKQYDDFESHKVYYGFIKDNDIIIDEVLLVAFRSPKSFTTEDTIEINCHGGKLVLKKVLELVLSKGARIADPGEFTKRAFLNGRIDLSKAEAVIDVINSKNDYSLNNSVNQLTGKLNNKISLLRSSILYEIAYIESAIDDPEHYNLDGYYETLINKVNDIKNELQSLYDSFRNGKIISEGINTVIIGKPNVGKSSFLNVLYGEERAIVSDIAGTTRDIINEEIIIDEINLNIIDTAGIRETNDCIEKIGVKKAYEYADKADLILLLIDSSKELDTEDISLLEYINNKKSIILLNKSDLNPVILLDDIRRYTDKHVISISAKYEDGILEFKKLIKDMFFNGNINFNDEVVITNERHLNLINLSINSIDEVINSILNNMPEDFISIDLTNAYEYLGAIIGEKIEDDIVDEIFSKFCTGK